MGGIRSLRIIALSLLLCLVQVSGATLARGTLALDIRHVPWVAAVPARPGPIAMFALDGRTWNHPTRQATQGLQFLGAYRLSGDGANIALAERNADYLLGRASRIDGALWFAFDFPWDDGDATPIQPPWYSGLTQAKALSLFSRLAQLTGKDRWRAAAAATFASFEAPRRAGHPWVTFVDDIGQTWIEEYPDGDQADVVLNGHIAAIFCLWDYWRATASPAAESLIWRAAAAVKAHLHEFRRPGAPSYYGLRFHAVHAAYHAAHIEQLRILAEITNDPWFAQQAEVFAADSAGHLIPPT